MIVGGGIAALEAALTLRDIAPELDVTMISAADRFTFAPAAVGAPFAQAVVRHFDLFRIANDLGLELIVGHVRAVYPDALRVELEDGRGVAYDRLLIATGAVPRGGVAGAVEFVGPRSVDAMRGVINDVISGDVTRLVFTLPGSYGWSLPLYELALLTVRYLAEHHAIFRFPNGAIRREFVEVEIVTPEETPLQAFGAEASASVAALLEDAGIGFHGSRTPIRFADGHLQALPGDPIAADQVVAMPQLGGVEIAGLPVDAAGLIRTDDDGRVSGTNRVYAAGDATAFPVKQGGIAAQQAVSAAHAIAVDAGCAATLQPFEPVLRAVLLTGSGRQYMEAGLQGGQGQTSTLGDEPLWWPPGKLAAHYLTPYLARLDADPATAET